MRFDQIDVRNTNNAQEKFDKKMGELVLKVREQMARAKPTRQIRMLFEEHDEIYNRCQAGDITTEEFKKIEKLILWEMSPVKVHTVSEFLALLKILGCPESDAEKIAYHENDHVSQAIQMGLEAEYALVYSRNSDGKYIMHPFMIWDVPVGLNQDLIRNVEELVISAPEDLSEDDMNKLEKLKKK